MNLSFVIPCYRSEHTIIPVLEEIRNKMIEQPEITYEVIPSTIIHRTMFCLFCTIMQISILS